VRSLRGRTVLVTREEGEDGKLTAALRALGARVVHVSLLETLPPEDEEPLMREAGRLGSYDWLLFTSARAVESLSRFVRENGRRPRVAAVGQGTASSAREAGFPPEVVGTEGALALVREMTRVDPHLAERSVLAPLAERAQPDGIRALREAGARVQVVTAYRTKLREEGLSELREALRRDTFDAVAFASPSAVEAFASARVALSCPLFAIGGTTAQALEDHGFGEAFLPDRPDFAELAELIARELGSHPEREA